MPLPQSHTGLQSSKATAPLSEAMYAQPAAANQQPRAASQDVSQQQQQQQQSSREGSEMELAAVEEGLSALDQQISAAALRYAWHGHVWLRAILLLSAAAETAQLLLHDVAQPHDVKLVLTSAAAAARQCNRQQLHGFGVAPCCCPLLHEGGSCC